MVEEFSQKTKEELKYYVYILIDPRNNKIFYVGKGYENRVFSHVYESIENPKDTEKLEIIRAIKKNNQDVKYYIIRHGLKENEAFLVESILIDFLTFKDFSEGSKITNIVAGHYSFNQGIKTVEECEILYNCEKLDTNKIEHNILVININKTFDTSKKKRKNENPIYERPNIYEATRGWWRLNKNKAKKVDFVLAEYKGIVRAIFKPNRWMQNENRNNRWGFEGDEVTDRMILDIYLNKEIPKRKGTRNPIRYL
ncbi:MAG TPA: excinuclease ABC [Porphyromonadaceae bacterium]|nr:excinuclease ABC [Porphyromonadaceae bacterium]